MTNANDRLYTDHRLLSTGTPPSWDLARHIFTRYQAGAIVVVAENPLAALAAVRKQWQRVLRQVQQERARTLRPARIMELSKTTSTMQALHFATALPCAVYFATPEHLASDPPDCRTLYALCNLSDAALQAITSRMSSGSVAVLYKN